MMRELLGAIGFLTRLPVPAVPLTDLYRLAAWFPAAGLMVGALTAAAFWAALTAGLPLSVAIWAAVAAEVWMTGALHPDGLADTADGMAGSTPQRRLEIMKDPRLGTYGVIALLLTLSGRGILLAGLRPDSALPVLVLAHGAARFPAVWALARYPDARAGGGLNSGFRGTGTRELAVAGVTVLAAALLLGLAAPGAWSAPGPGAAGLPAGPWPLGPLAVAVAAVLAGMGATAFAARRLGGITGDVCGAVAEVALLTGLLAAVALQARGGI